MHLVSHHIFFLDNAQGEGIMQSANTEGWESQWNFRLLLQELLQKFYFLLFIIEWGNTD